MRVLLTGATGFVGGAILSQLLADGHEVIAAVRRAKDRKPRAGVQFVDADFTRDLIASAWSSRVAGTQAVVNAVGIIRETAELKFQALHADAPLALFQAAREAGVERVVQISAYGVSDQSEFEYFTSKAQADRYLLDALAERALILRPSLVYGEKGEATRLFQRLAQLPVIPLPAGGAFRFRPILVEDLASLVGQALSRQALPSGVFALGGDDDLSLREILVAIRAWSQGAPQDSDQWLTAPTVSVPLALMKPAAWAGDLTGLGPLDSDMLGMLTRNEAPDIAALVKTFGGAPRGLVSFLKEHPRTAGV